MIWEALGWLGEDWAWSKTCVYEDLEQGVCFSAVDRYCSDVDLLGGVGV